MSTKNLILLAVLIAPFARAADTCTNLDFLEHRKYAVAVAKEKTFFWKTNSGCPDEAKADCKTKAFVVDKDEVVFAHSKGDWACAWFQPTKKNKTETVGWVMKKSFKETKAKKVSGTDFLGNWEFNKNSLEVKKAKRKNFFSITGSAQWVGMGEGAINVGKIEATSAPTGNRMKLESDGCELELQLVGNYIIAKDNLSCGGLNVSFSGVYAKAKPRDPSSIKKRKKK